MNGLHPSHQGPDEEQPTERTALLSRLGTEDRQVGDAESQHPSRPSIDPIVIRLQEHGLPEDFNWCPDLIPSTERTSFIVVTLLQLRHTLMNQNGSAADSWEQWLGEQHRTDMLDNATKQLCQIWTEFLAEAHTSEEVEEFLWTEFPLKDEEPLTARVVDFLGHSYGPEELITHRVILLTLLGVWKHGRHGSLREGFTVSRLGAKFDAISSPSRALHLLDLTIYLGYVVILAHYALFPPSRPIEAESSDLSIRAILLVIYSFARLCQTWSIFTAPFVLLLVAFLSALPFAPSSEDTSYSVILLSLSLHVLQLQLPYPPGPLHLFPPDQALPVAILIWHGVSRVFFPVVIFFLPGLMLALFLLSTSLSDTLFQPFVLLTLHPSPMEARTVFLVLFALLFILLLCSLLVLALIYPSVTFGPPAISVWDRYSRSIGVEARRNFARTVIMYSNAYRFIPPFNILEFMLSQFPALLLRLTGRKRAESWPIGPRQILWRITPVLSCAPLFYPPTRKSTMSRPHKRQRTIALGAPQEDDSDLPTPHTEANAPSSAAWSVRDLPHEHPLPLSLLAMRALAHNLGRFTERSPIWEYIRQQLKELPDMFIPRLFEVLRQICPRILNHAFITAYLLRGSTITLTDELPGVNKFTISAIVNASSYTAVPPLSLAPILKNCKGLEVLKLAGITSWTDATVNKLWFALGMTETSGFELPALRTLKLRQTYLTDATINVALSVSPNIRRLDLSFTLVRHPPLLINNTSLEKLSLTSTKVSSADLLKIVSGMTKLKTLVLGAMGRDAGSVAAVSNTTAMTMTDETLRKLTSLLAHCDDIENILNLAGITSLRSSDLEGLPAEELGQPHAAVQTLILNNTSVDDSAAPFIASCDSLQTLELSGTKLTSEGLDEILDACVHLENLNLTSCRGVDVAHRRRYFEVYEEKHQSTE
ncbi:hypothetical protein NM688_g3753 [Phlebia brevispora]|uniref:Uncharacterized protein n=1 Tax=Phlebia brevispora TaxID=194682 RepID=A0ACC1T514_9APHY|nr:hypothetical protein NM688_g3753 [Phlebia brevispora]